jgi:UDP-N-acetylmuramate--alanine ligase
MTQTRPIAFDLGPVHFVGVGGIGMSGIAEVMANLGYRVQGSDAKASANTARLEARGVRVMIGHRAENLGDAAVVVISTAIKAGNPEVDAARARGLPVVRRAEMLAELMRLKWTVAVGGTHGKTTTTSMVATLLDAAGIDPTVINGGIINAYGSNARLGAGDWMVVEADESDGTFTRLRPTCVIVTNMDAEHLDHYGTVEKMKEGFETFVSSIPFYGFAVLCLDHPEVQALVGRTQDRRVITYGFNPQADVRGLDLVMDRDGARFSVDFRPRGALAGHRIEALHLPMAGQHNVSNAIAAIAVARELGASDEAIREGLARFGGVKRRFTHAGGWNGATIIDDYAHHPVEIAAVLKAARQVSPGRVIAVVQPHRYTRLRDLFADFVTCLNDADVAVIADVYAAGEAAIPGAGADDLAAGLVAAGHRRVLKLESLDSLAAVIGAEARPGDYVVCMGAGDITTAANGLQAALEAGA